MDVRCEKCNSEYEFDASRIPPEGLPVKCSSCGHVFRVGAPADALPGPGNAVEWMIRQPSGNVFRFRELTTLQRWIVERKVSRGDEISKSGRHWKRLGDIAELATFFQVVDAAQPVAAAPQPTWPAPVAQPSVPLTAQPTVPLAPAAPVAAAPFVPAPRPTGPQAPVAPGALPTGYPGGAAWEGAPQQVPWQQPSGNWQMQPGGAAPELDDYPVRRGGKGKWVVLALVLLIAGAGAGTYVLRPDLVDRWLGRGVNELAVNHVKIGYTELQRDSYAAIDAAIDNFEKAIALGGDYADAKAGLAEAELARAEYLKEEADELTAQLDKLTDVELERAKAAIEAKRREVSLRSDRAFTLAKEALTLDPTGLAGNRAMADYYRFKNAAEQMRPLLDKARAASPGDPRVAYVLGSSLIGDPTLADRALRYFDEALEGAPEMQRARYRLARLYAAQNNPDKAKTLIELILKAVPDHERAKALQTALAPPAPPPVEPAPVEEKAPTLEQLLAQADRLRNSDRAGKALKLYEQAQELEPEDPDIFVGIGWCYVDLEQPAAAISSFKNALRLAPRLSDAHFGLAEAYRNKGDKANAAKHYREFLDILPSGEDAEVARRMLEQLK